MEKFNLNYSLFRLFQVFCKISYGFATIDKDNVMISCIRSNHIKSLNIPIIKLYFHFTTKSACKLPF